MNKPIEETHPSLNQALKETLGYVTPYCIPLEEIQKHTIDKQMLKKAIFNESLFPMYDENYRHHLCKKLRLEELQ